MDSENHISQIIFHKEVYARHGIDNDFSNDFSNITAWIKRNADRAFNSH